MDSEKYLLCEIWDFQSSDSSIFLCKVITCRHRIYRRLELRTDLRTGPLFALHISLWNTFPIVTISVLKRRRNLTHKKNKLDIYIFKKVHISAAFSNTTWTLCCVEAAAPGLDCTSISPQIFFLHEKFYKTSKTHNPTSQEREKILKKLRSATGKTDEH